MKNYIKSLVKTAFEWFVVGGSLTLGSIAIISLVNLIIK